MIAWMLLLCMSRQLTKRTWKREKHIICLGWIHHAFCPNASCVGVKCIMRFRKSSCLPRRYTIVYLIFLFIYVVSACRLKGWRKSLVTCYAAIRKGGARAGSKVAQENRLFKEYFIDEKQLVKNGLCHGFAGIADGNVCETRWGFDRWRGVPKGIGTCEL